VSQEGRPFLAQQSIRSDPNADTHYQLLGLDFRATPAEVTRAYRRKMKDCHPDLVAPARRGQAERYCQNINQAYAILKDPIKRREYDQSIRVQEVQDQVMNRYVGGLGGPAAGGHDPHASKLRRPPTAFERAEMRQADRSATFSLLGAFAVVTIGAIVVILVVALLATVAGLFL
jgi:DnaJ-class molecular chaperone